MPPISTLEEAASYLEGLINNERLPQFQYARLGLGPIRRLLRRLGNPERELSVLHVAGSKGKGSTALFAESLLTALGERVGTFTSPHLVRWTERFRLDGREVEGSLLASCVDRVRPHVDALRREDPKDAPTFFDATTAAGLLLFAEAGVDRAIVEVGIGGRLDSTNVVAPAVCCITSIELEHTDKLGETLGEIAGEKAGIVKAGVPCVTGRLPDEAAAVVAARCSQAEAPLLRLGREFSVELDPEASGDTWTRVRYREPDGFGFETALSVPGLHQADNAAVAAAAVRRLGAHDDAALAGAAEKGLARTRLPGRVEVLERRPWVVVDSAHTAASARALADTVARFPARRRHWVLSVSIGKDVDAILQALLTGAASVTVTRAEPSRSLDPREVAAAIRVAAPDVPARVVPNPQLAVRAAREALEDEDLLCVAGSFYLAGIARSVLSEASGRPVGVSRRGGRGA